MTFGNFCLTVINKLPEPKTDYWQLSEYKISINFEIACLPAKKMRSSFSYYCRRIDNKTIKAAHREFNYIIFEFNILNTLI